ncbi:double zinc ribbon domain-containing protein [Microcoleus anatoxicus]|uniref:NACHT C-terminal alpha/beta 1 domain-containing protein n=1 Tax=Microcoleus anatoxicus TaxID=2705319 RepID=UPI002978BCE0|nr:MAG: NACHT domain-containing protein [Oscillatoriales cyanobacterium]
MGKLVVFNLGEGDFQRGFPVTLQVWEEGGFPISFYGKLPASAIDSLYDKWQSDYRQKVSGRMIPKPGRVSNRSDTDLTENSNILKAELNNWLNSETFRPVRDKFLTTVKSKHTVRVIIQTENPRLRRLPWYLWDLFVKNYPLAEMALSSPTFERVEKSVQPKPKVRILAILGDSSPPDPQTGIRLDINADKQFLENLPDAETVFLVEPKRHEFNEQLWDERGWDILFFAGHSTSESDGTTGKIYINSKEYLTIDDLKPALHKAIQRGLQLAIFNSCDGLGIARDLAELQIPQIIAMREPVADLVAKEFLKYFLDSFSKGQHLYLAVREARERLHGLEKDFPCASWLPVICQNPAENPVTWQGLRGVEAGINWRDACLRTIPERGKLTSNSLVVNDGLNLNVDDVYVPLGLVERKQKPKPDKHNKPDKGSQLYAAKTPSKSQEAGENYVAKTQYEVTKTFKNDEFFGEVLKQGKTDKSKGKRIAIIGEPGAGKTTLLQKIADWVLAETEVVPIWVSLADLGKFSLEDYLLQKWLKVALNVADVTAQMRQDLVTLFNNHQVWLLLDAADEMSAGNPLDEIKSQLRGWIAEARVVLTCRYNVWDAGKNALADFDVYRNLDFDEEEQIPQFIRSVFQQSDLGERLCQQLAKSENTRLRDTVKNPLRLTLLCLAWHIRQGDFTTKTQADLYAQFTEAVYEWKREKFPTTSQQRRELNKALATLALRGMEEKESRFRLRQGWVREVLGEADEPLCELALQLGWINRVGVAAERPEEQVYAFYHPTFQEYFAALGVDDWGYFLHHVPDNPGLGIYRIFEKQWKQVILLWFGREDVEKEKKEEFMRALVYFEHSLENIFYWYRAYFLAAEALVEFQECDLFNEVLNKLIYGDFSVFETIHQKVSELLKKLTNCPRTLPIKDRIQDVLNTICQNKDDKSMANDEINDEINKSVHLYSLYIAFKEVIKYLEETYNDPVLNHSKFYYNLKIGLYCLSGMIEACNIWLTINQREAEENRISLTQALEIPEINSLVQVIEENQNRENVIQAMGRLSEMSTGRLSEMLKYLIPINSLKAINTLSDLIMQTSEKNIILLSAEILGKIDPGNSLAVNALINLMESSYQDEYYYGDISLYILRKILINKDMAKIVSRLENYICYTWTDSWEDHLENYPRLYELLWLCTVNMTYIDYSQAWKGVECKTCGRRKKIFFQCEFCGYFDESKQAIEGLKIFNTGLDYILYIHGHSINLETSENSDTYKPALVNELQNTTISSNIICPVCSNKNTEGSDFCENCGYEVSANYSDNTITCPVCGHKNSEGSEFCDVCGNELGVTLPNQTSNDTIICPYCIYDNPNRNEFCDACGYDLATNWIAVDNTITCPVCSYKNSEGSEFCDVCGNELGVTLPTQTLNDTIICQACSYDNPNGNEFCDACGYELPVIVSYNFEDTLDPLIQSLENQITPNFSQLQPTPQTYPLPINIQSLTDETDTSAICQELCTQIYYLALPDTDIPTANNFAQLKRHILTAKRQLQKRHLALILHECEPDSTLITCCRKIADANLGLHIAWITDTPLDAPLRGFPPQQPNLLGAIQTWINELS